MHDTLFLNWLLFHPLPSPLSFGQDGFDLSSLFLARFGHSLFINKLPPRSKEPFNVLWIIVPQSLPFILWPRLCRLEHCLDLSSSIRRCTSHNFGRRSQRVVHRRVHSVSWIKHIFIR